MFIYLKKTANLITLITSTSATHTRFPRLDQNSDVVSLTLTSILFCEEANGKKPNLASSAGGGQQLGSQHSAMWQSWAYVPNLKENSSSGFDIISSGHHI